MATKLPFLVLFVFLASLLSPTFSTKLPKSVDLWCKKTPYPRTCKYSWSQNQKFFLPKHNSDFKKFSLEIAMKHALKAQSHNKWIGSKCRNEKEKAAWLDCLKLYEDTILLLNQTLNHNTNCSNFDSQTWLSTALTNLDTCRAGFSELGVSDFVLPLMSNNVSKLISNTLAINKNSSAPAVTNRYKEGFPSWLSPGDRKLLQVSSPRPNLVVARDGSGDQRTIKAAFGGGGEEEWEMLVGDGMRNTIITGSRSVGGGSTTFNSATVAVTANGFIARGITFRNMAGPQNHQAVALRSGADLSVFYRCGFEGYQDTLYVHSQRQFYKECYIHGTVDFIFGNAAVVFQNCIIYARKPLSKQKITITAQGRTDPNQNTGISIHNSRVMAGSDLKLVIGSFETYLGRPWKAYSRTVFVQTFLDILVEPAGWLEWDGSFALNTLFYGEYKNFGPGSSLSGRVKWRGYRVITSDSEASKFTVANFIAGRSWLPTTGVPFTLGL
ncbi:hypothetical protein UlMin_026536 [Ulmus minor]